MVISAVYWRYGYAHSHPFPTVQAAAKFLLSLPKQAEIDCITCSGGVVWSADVTCRCVLETLARELQ